MNSLIIIVLFAGTFLFIYLMEEKKRKIETERFREFARALLSRNVQEYSETTPMENEELPEEIIEDELVDLEKVPPEELLKAAKEEQDAKYQ